MLEQLVKGSILPCLLLFCWKAGLLKFLYRTASNVVDLRMHVHILFKSQKRG